MDLKKDYKGIRGLSALYRRLLAKRPTAVADFHNVLRTRYLRFRFLLGGYSVAHINKHKQGKKLLCREENKVFILFRAYIARELSESKAKTKLELSRRHADAVNEYER